MVRLLVLELLREWAGGAWHAPLDAAARGRTAASAFGARVVVGDFIKYKAHTVDQGSDDVRPHAWVEIVETARLGPGEADEDDDAPPVLSVSLADITADQFDTALPRLWWPADPERYHARARGESKEAHMPGHALRDDAG